MTTINLPTSTTVQRVKPARERSFRLSTPIVYLLLLLYLLIGFD